MKSLIEFVNINIFFFCSSKKMRRKIVCAPYILPLTLAMLLIWFASQRVETLVDSSTNDIEITMNVPAQSAKPPELRRGKSGEQELRRERSDDVYMKPGVSLVEKGTSIQVCHTSATPRPLDIF
jgi:hypothetical protein